MPRRIHHRKVNHSEASTVDHQQKYRITTGALILENNLPLKIIQMQSDLELNVDVGP